ncbi:MAG TPA: hypothetical protein VFA54_07845 [Bryobacterales bacterium]|nr:hypothetical protein [Bryobacterales bacterium]
MGNAEHDRRIAYIEFPASGIAEAKEFDSMIFGRRFEDYGPDYELPRRAAGRRVLQASASARL